MTELALDRYNTNAIVVLALFYLHLIGPIFDWIGRIIFFSGPIILLYNLIIYFLLARRLNQNHTWIETMMMGIILLASFPLLIVTVFFIGNLISGGGMPVPAD